MALRALSLDVGNTLLREQPSRFELYAAAARLRGVAIAEPEMAGLMRRAHDELPCEIDGAWRYTDPWFESYIERIFHAYLGVPRGALAELSTELFGRFAEAGTFEFFPGVLELVAHARERGLRVGVISNWSTRLPALLARLGLAERLDFVLCSAIERLEKPDPAIFQRALDLAEAAPHEVLHAGDDLRRDVLGARQAGLHSVLVDHGGLHADWGARYGPRVTGLAEIASIIDRMTDG